MRVHMELVTSAAVMILTILTIAVFIVYGYTALSYALFAAVLAFAFANAWLIQRDLAGRPPRAAAGRRRKLKR